jgi:hypothetical protein
MAVAVDVLVLARQHQEPQVSMQLITVKTVKITPAMAVVVAVVVAAGKAEMAALVAPAMAAVEQAVLA